MSLPAAPRILCAICKKPVQKTEWWDDPSSYQRVLRAYCHGATDEMRLDFARLRLSDLAQLSGAVGEAFATSAIAGPSVRGDAGRPQEHTDDQ